ncbi:MAG TPA: hypothetical protein PK040_06055 [Anaerolineaceae bacterium]|nr:hypothetical protein [Anaerolineaceae bacterium]
MKKLIVFSVLCLLLLSACAKAAPTTAPVTSEASVTAEGQTLLETRCTTCHTLDKAISENGNASQWTRIVERMISNGAQLTDAEKAVLIDYLAATYK